MEATTMMELQYIDHAHALPVELTFLSTDKAECLLIHHKEESVTHIKYDPYDRHKIFHTLTMCIDPFKYALSMELQWKLSQESAHQNVTTVDTFNIVQNLVCNIQRWMAKEHL